MFRLLFTTLYGFISIIIYSTIMVMIVKYRKSDFSNVFYTFFLVLGATNIFNYLLNYVSLHIPEYLTENSTITEYYETELSGAWGVFFWVGTFHLNFVQFGLNFFVALNRFTCIVFYANHETIWRYALIPSLLISFLLPFVFTAPMISYRSYFLFFNGFVMLMTDYDIDLIYLQITIVASSIGVLMVFFSVFSIVRLHHRRVSSRHEMSLFIVSFAICTVFVLDTVYLTLLTYTTFICEVSCSGALLEFNIILNLLIPYTTDAFSLLDPYLMLLINSRLRKKLLTFIGFKKLQKQKIVPITHSAEKMTSPRS